MRVAMLAVIVVSASTTAARTPPGARVYTVAQAEAGRVAIAQNSFGDCRACHTSTLRGRTGAAGELPPIASLSDDYQTLVNGNGGRVPPLVGAEFVSRWSRRSTKRLVEEFDKRFSPPLSVDTRLDIIAYMLQASGAPAGTDPLTATTDVPFTSLFTGDDASYK